MPLEPKTVQAIKDAWKGVRCHHCDRQASRLREGRCYCWDCWIERFEKPEPVVYREHEDPMPKQMRSRR